MNTGPERRVFRIVIGCYGHPERHWSARHELRARGLRDDQMCSVGSRRALDLSGPADPDSGDGLIATTASVRFEHRRIGALDIEVSCASLFDWLLPATFPSSGGVWLAATQSGVILRRLKEDCGLLLVSSNSAQQQVTSSQIQLRHQPIVVQAFNFAA